MTEQSAVVAENERLRFSDLLLEEIITAIALAIVVFSVSWGVVTRYILPTPAAWTSELASISFAWVVFLGSAAAFRRKGHIAIDSFLPLLPASLAGAVRLLAALIVLATLLVMTFLSIRFTLSTLDIPTTVLRLPQAVIYAAAGTGFGLMTVRHLQSVFSSRSSEGASS